MRKYAASALSKLGQANSEVLPTVRKWVEQHQDSKYVGYGMDAPWNLLAQE